ncbi:LLM class flavin-dependent oxidoreductase [Streptomyces olivaceus]|uniref:LLM class flavin-dependent oxidoreductase n=1 Tax=Streptomyces olivaceus TaxID=47716 RepID=UPI0035D9C86D
MPLPTLSIALDLGSDRPVAAQLAAAAPLLRTAAEAGADSVWLGESYHDAPEPFHLPSPLITLAHLAALTPLKLGTGVLLSRAYDAHRLAYEAALVDQLSDGRLTLGLGLGAPALRGTLGGPDRAAGAHLDSVLHTLRDAWGVTDGPATRAGKADPSPPARVAPPPLQPGGPRLLIGGQGEAAVRRASTVGDGWYCATNYSDTLLRTQCARLRDHPSRTRTAISVNRLCLVGGSDAELGAAGKAFADVTGYYTRRGLWNAGAAAGDPPPVLVGTPDDVLERLGVYGAWGVTHVQLRVLPAGVSPATAVRSIRLLAYAGAFAPGK